MIGRWRAACTALMAMGLAGTSGLPAAEPVRLVVTAAPAAFSEMFQEIAQAFTREHPDILVDLRVSAREYDDLAQSTLREAVIGALPDVSLQGINYVRLLTDRGWAVPLDPFLRNLEFAGGADALTGSSAAIGRIGDRTMAIPVALSLPVLYVNVDVVERCGGPDVSAAMRTRPLTWHEVTDLAARLSAACPRVLGGFFQYTSGGNWLFQALVTGHGGRMDGFESQRTTASREHDREAVARALGILRDFGLAGQARFDMSQSQARQAFAAGVIGILADSGSAGALLTRESGGRFRMAVAPFPIASPTGRVPPAGFVAVMFARDAARQRAAFEWIKFLVSEPAQVIVVRRTTYAPVNRATLTVPVVAALYRDDPNRRVPLEQLSRLTGFYAFPSGNALKIVATIRAILESVVTLESSPEAALHEMETAIAGLLVD
jgi:multiple sugar transport system substrate-binding protein